MPTLVLHTHIHAPRQRVFDLSRSVDLHQISTQQTNERVVDGVMSGLMYLNDWATWEAKHFGITQTLTSKITEYTPYESFTDVMVQGAFKAFTHDHIFELTDDSQTYMTDVFTYSSPFGFIGKFADQIFLKSYMRKFITKRNVILKQYAESNLWKLVLPNEDLKENMFS